MYRQHRSVREQSPPDQRLRSWLLLVLLPVALCLTACGGGGGGTGAPATTDTPPIDTTPTAQVTQLTPSVLQANFNEPIELRGEGFVAPVVVRFRNEGGDQLGSDVDMQVIDGGRGLRGRAPRLPGIAGREACAVEVQNGDGEVLALDQEVTFECPVPGSRAINGFANNLSTPDVGGAGTALRSDVPRAYDDGISAPSGADRPSARVVSNLICAQEEPIASSRGVTDMFWLWGQFLDHDIDLTGEADPTESFPIEIPLGDAYFDPFFTGAEIMDLHRSTWLAGSGTSPDNPRRQPNEITSWIDASNVYGSDAERARALRTLDGTGRMRTSEGDFLPYNTDGLPNAGSSAPTLFLAGDVRANEQVGLTALHTLFVREHNRVADEVRTQNPHLTGDEIYEAARSWVGAEIQVITYREFLPLLIGEGTLPAYSGYDDSVDAGIGVLFSTAAYRFGHSMVSDTVLRLDENGETVAEGNLSLRDAFFNPSLLPNEGGLDPVLRGYAAQIAQELDPKIVDDLRNFLFGPPGAGGLDLAALNLQRGRDHGLPSYNACRVALGLASNGDMADITSDEATAEKLASAYGDTSDIDVWVGALCEERVPGAMVGELLHHVFSDQFRRLRDGDRFWYQNVYRGEALRQLESVRLADVIRRNTGIGSELRGLVMVDESQADGPTRPPPRRRDDGNVQLQSLALLSLSR